MIKEVPHNPDQKKRRRFLSINKIIPNALTVGALCAGLTAIRFAIDDKLPEALIAILFAAILDTLDGRMARLLNAQSKFGAELDSLSDVVSFGVAPALILYFWTLQAAGSWGWIASLTLAACCALRLARFNVKLDEEEPPFAKNFFQGVPAPAGAGLALLPAALELCAAKLGYAAEWEAVKTPEAVAVWTVLVGFLFVSSVPTYSGKSARIPHKMMVPLLAGVALFIAMLVTKTWPTISLFLLSYLALIPFSWLSYRRQMKAFAAGHVEEILVDDAVEIVAREDFDEASSKSDEDEKKAS